MDVSFPTTPYTRMANYLDMAGNFSALWPHRRGIATAIQFIVRRFKDRTMLRVARAIEAVTPQMVACP